VLTGLCCCGLVPRVVPPHRPYDCNKIYFTFITKFKDRYIWPYNNKNNAIEIINTFYNVVNALFATFVKNPKRPAWKSDEDTFRKAVVTKIFNVHDDIKTKKYCLKPTGYEVDRACIPALAAGFAEFKTTRNGHRTIYTREDFVVTQPSMFNFRFRKAVRDPAFGTVITNKVRFAKNFDRKKATLGEGATKILNTPNAGGNSIWSEVFSLEVLEDVFGVKLLKTEMEIEYKTTSKITDYLADIDGEAVGVSVSRIINFRDLKKKYKGIFTIEELRGLLYKKLYGVIASTAAASKTNKWTKQILHIWTTSAFVTEKVVEEYYKIDPCYRSNTCVVVTTAENGDFIF
jgi:hypothetical protein